MFASLVNNVNGNAKGLNETINNINKRSKVCDAGPDGKINPNCLR